jgi:hypothetical protein
MFWGKKNKTDKPAEPKKNNKPDKKKKSKGKKEKKGVGNSDSQRLSSEKLREEALANARLARETLGDETIQRIAAALHKKQNSDIEKAKQQIAGANVDRVLDELMWMLQDKNKK